MLKSKNTVVIFATLMIGTSMSCFASDDDKTAVKLTAAAPAPVEAPAKPKKKSFWSCCGDGSVDIKESLKVAGAITQVGLKIAEGVVTDPTAKKAIHATETGLSALNTAVQQASSGGTDGAINAVTTIANTALDTAADLTGGRTAQILNATSGVVDSVSHQAQGVVSGEVNLVDATVVVTNAALSVAGDFTDGKTSEELHKAAAVIDGISVAAAHK